MAKQAEAEALLASARADVDESAAAAAAILDQMCEGMPDGQWHTSEFLAGLWSWVTGIAMLVARFNSVRATLDWNGFVTDGNALGEGIRANLTTVSDNPHDFGRVFLDTQTLHDNPARWWGAMAPDAALTVAGGIGAGSRSLSAVSAQLRAVDWASDSGAIDIAAFLRRDPLPLANGSVLDPLDATQIAGAEARFADLPESHLRSRGAEQAYQVDVYGVNERGITLPSGRHVYPDGFTPGYGALGDAKFVSSPRSFYVPDSMNSPALAQFAMDKMDATLANLAQAARVHGAGAVELTTNSAEAAAFIQSRMSALDIPGYVRIVESGP
ncbi:hypothetical protein ICW40_05690 [Actinotalea ferrariae]|nr:hypothetical protein [Actinotalea ferrariae]